MTVQELIKALEDFDGELRVSVLIDMELEDITTVGEDDDGSPVLLILS